ncbi:MAG: hypothetical protein WC205_08265 [Opitutaceae bacterium]|jgi:Spy/CpxP family protein refolding chaperone
MAANLKIVLAVGGIFLAGAVTGGFVGVRVVEHMAAGKRAIPRIGPTEIGGRLAEQLNLTAEQKQKIQPVFARISEELRKVRRDSFTKTAALITQMDVEMSKVLTPEQRVRLQAIRTKEEERRKQWMTERAERAKHNDTRPPGGPEGEGHPPEPPPGPPVER